MPNLKVSQLVLDYGLYPRHHLDDMNCRRIRAAIEAGEKLPPLTVDRKTKRVADGFHRATEYGRIDADYSVAVEFKDYVNDSELFLDAVRRNARHGTALTSFDHARVITLADGWKISHADIAAALAVPLATIDKVKIARSAKATDGRSIQVKRSFSSLAGSVLPPKMERLNNKAQGFSASFYAEQLITLMDAGVVDWDDAATNATLTKLLGYLSSKLVA